MRVAVAVSGGVDSLCALALLRAAGHQVLALHGLFLPESGASRPRRDPLPGLAAACALLDIPLHVIDLRETFERAVITSFAHAYAAGRTPNPCALCNRAVKFGALLDAAFALGAEKLATGHYARLLPPLAASDAPLSLSVARDAAKDQSYFLSLVPADRLRHALFPLADLSKARSAALVAEAGLAVPLPAKARISALCRFKRAQATLFPGLHPQAGATLLFLPPDGAPAALPRRAPARCCWPTTPGNLREIARHQGLWRYTEGQRKGLGIAHSEPLYVLAKDTRQNALLVGPRALLGMNSCEAADVNVLLEPDLWPERILARLRYRQPAGPGPRALARRPSAYCPGQPLLPQRSRSGGGRV